ncbi:3-hydroxyacyl-CoA dehydrogenase [Trinickia symbiotica]|uniref:3-hydroxyacyl-CoA dehydrogenase n=1 Tax=Trinickia symbiotica TaxID=863227 RepID=A0A2N7WL37_9BURK|nr:3-hydroxyacyl-CoA dehydrogenase NAD-binding domain-containing protein [Trinickia symbiotica]PMS30133.1 3-hydroxyacyl-CoA dehydrogenase [Trinickia symbiotica]PPK42605.1 3-hydroxyacyl-CoA dehydrogenase [Trinickia symbiotica]
MDTLTNAASKQRTESVRIEKRGNVGYLVIDNPPVNASSVDVRRGVLEGLKLFEADASLMGVVIIGGGNTFIAGSDIREFDAPIEAPSLPEVNRAIESSPLPVVAAIHGTALGGGFELALACDGRVAMSSALVGLPEVSLGMIPGAGGTQRVAFITGKATAIEVVTSSRRLSAAEALHLGLIDHMVDDDLPQAAEACLTSLRRKKCRVRDRQVPDSTDKQLEMATETALRLRKALPHVQQAIDAVNMAGVVSFDEALSRERSVFEALRTSSEARAYRHLFFSERACLRSGSGGRSVGANIRKIGVVGAGTMGVGIAGCFADAGFEVSLYDANRDALQAALGKLEDIYATQVLRKAITDGEKHDRISRVRLVEDLSGLGDVDLAIEAVFEDFDVKLDVMQRLNEVLSDHAVLASNTSYLDLNSLAHRAGRPARTVGLHFFSPAQTMRLLEIVETKHTSQEIVDAAVTLARKLGKVPVVARVAEGFIGNRIYAAYRKQCEYMIEEGALPEQVDAALEEFGFAMGPFAVADLSGLDIAWKMRQRLNAASKPQRYVTIPDALCEAARFGRKTGAGWYMYKPQSRRGVPDPVVHSIIAVEREKKGIKARKLGKQEIVERAMAAIVNEAVRVLEEGTARRASDIDIVLVHGYGFPRYLGGPLWWAQQLGMDKLSEIMTRLETASGADFVAGDITKIFAQA